MALAGFQKKFKTIALIVGLLVVLGITIVLGKQASTFFARASSCGIKNVQSSQVTANNAVISWETDEVTQGRIEYGTSATNLTFSAPESSSGKVHNVPLTLLTPNTIYYYLITVGDTKCDTSATKCDQNCVPWSFTTSAVIPQKEAVVPVTSPTLASPKVGSPSATPSVLPTKAVSTTSAVTGISICPQVKLNIGASSQDASRWAVLRQYDIDNNGVINGLDVVKCQQQGK